MYNFWYFVAFYAVLLEKVYLFAIYAVIKKIGLLQVTCYCLEKILAKISDRGEKMTNIRYVELLEICTFSRRLKLTGTPSSLQERRGQINKSFLCQLSAVKNRQLC